MQGRKNPPAPFRRPGIELQGSARPRSWKRVQAHLVARGDTVADLGLVTSVFDEAPDEPGSHVLIWAGGRDLPTSVPRNEELLAFTEDE
jgi:hypothetical protein